MNILSALVSILSPFILSSTHCSSASIPIHPSNDSSQGRRLFHLAKVNNLSSFHGTFGSSTHCSWPSPSSNAFFPWLPQRHPSLWFSPLSQLTVPSFSGFTESTSSSGDVSQRLFFVFFAFPVHILSSESDSSLRTLSITRVIDSPLYLSAPLALSSGILKSYIQPPSQTSDWYIKYLSERKLLILFFLNNHPSTHTLPSTLQTYCSQFSTS